MIQISLFFAVGEIFQQYVTHGEDLRIVYHIGDVGELSADPNLQPSRQCPCTHTLVEQMWIFGSVSLQFCKIDRWRKK